MVDFHCALGPNKHFDERAVLQPTWNKIIHVLLGITGQKHKRAQVREYQRTQLARKRGDSCLVELLPLPSPDRIGFLFDEYSKTIPFLESPDDYKEHVRPKRIVHLKRKIEKYRPKAVVFYGKRNWKYYHKIAGVKFRSTKIDGVKIGNNEDTFFVLTKHPNARGATNDDFYRIGKMIARDISTHA